MDNRRAVLWLAAVPRDLGRKLVDLLLILSGLYIWVKPWGALVKAQGLCHSVFASRGTSLTFIYLLGSVRLSGFREAYIGQLKSEAWTASDPLIPHFHNVSVASWG